MRVRWVPTAICPHCKEAAHVYFCLRDPGYLADPEGFVNSIEAREAKSALESPDLYDSQNIPEAK